MAGYAALPEVYEWLMPDAKLSPAGSVAEFADVVQSLPPNARVLDCSCGSGQLAVGLAGLGLDVVASDASSGMVRRTRELAEEHHASLRTLQARWSELLQHLDPSSFDLITCVGNSLTHAEGASGRLTALAAMSRLLGPGGRLVLTSRTWELVRARGSRIDVRDRVIRRRGRDGVVIYYWQVEHLWEDEHSPGDCCRTTRARRVGRYLFGAVVLLAISVRGARGGAAERRARGRGEHLQP